MLVFVFLTLLYPLFHNSLLFVLNYLADLLGQRIGKGNVLLLGWKEAVLLAVFPLLLFRRNKMVGVAFVLSAILAILLRKILFIKELLMPFGLLLVYWNYEDECARILLRYRRSLKIITAIGVLVILSIGYADYIFRVGTKIDQENYVNYRPMMLNNEIRCSKYLASGATQAEYDECVSTSRLNFYKLKHRNDVYTFMHALFLPVGDSVVFSFVLVWAFLILRIFRDPSTKERWHEVFVYIIILSSVFFTLNRVNSLLVVSFLVASIFFGNRLFGNWKKNGIFLFILAFVFLINSGYLFLSIFDRMTPSNIGHFESIRNVWESQLRPRLKKITKSPAADSRVVADDSNRGTSIVEPDDNVAASLSDSSGEIQNANGPRGIVRPLANSIESPGKMEDRIIENEQKPSGVSRQKLLESITDKWSAVKSRFHDAVLAIPRSKMWQLIWGDYSSTAATESNLMKVVIHYGLFGMVFYGLILAGVGYKLVGLVKHCAKESAHRIDCIFLILSGVMILSYQLISPYIISGYVVFYPFASILFLYSGYLRARELESPV